MVAATKLVEAVAYPETDDAGEHEVQLFITLVLLAQVEQLLRARRRLARVSGNQYFYWAEGDPTKCRAPDLYVVDGVPQDAPDRGVWKTWEGHAPSFALEIVSAKWKKDYAEAPVDYAAMGVRELVVFDPWATARSRKRVRWQVYRSVRGQLRPVPVEQSDRVASRELGCFLRVVDDKGRVRLRVGTGAGGDTLMPTDAEAADAMRVLARITEAQAEAERTARQAAERQAVEERAAREAAERQAADEISRLRAEIARLRGGG